MLKIKKYTKEEEQLILENSKKKVNKLSHQELADMMGRTVEGIRKKEKDLKRKLIHNKRLSNKWTEEEEDIIREHLNKENFAITNLIKLIKKDIRTIEAKALEISIELKKDKKAFKYWTKEDEEYLKKWYGIERPIIIGIYLGRSLESIHQKAKKMKLGSKKIHYSARECASLLGLEESTFLSYLYKGYVKSRKAVTEQLIHQIQIEDLYDFMKNHQDKWDSRNLSYEPFLTQKPEWYIDKCKKDRNSPVNYLKRHVRWTDDEVDTLYSMRESGASFSEIAIRLNRSVSSVENRWNKRNVINKRRALAQEKIKLKELIQKQKENITRLIDEMENEKAYLVRKVYKINARKMTEDDIEFISNLRMVGYSSKEISNLVGCGDRYIKQVLEDNKDEEYVVNIKSKKIDRKEDLFKMVNEDYSIYELCLEFNADYPTIINCYKKLIEEKDRENYIDGAKHRVWTKEDDEKLLKLKAEGLRFRVIAYQMNKTVCSVKNRYHILSTKKNKAA